MKSTFQTEIDGPPAKVAELYSNMDNIVKWMDDIRKCEHVGGTTGKAGSKYRFVPKKGEMDFTATILEKTPALFKMKMEGANVDVMVTARFNPAAVPAKTKFESEEVFTFKGFINKMVGLISGAAVRKAHTKHMKAFKKFAKHDLSHRVSSPLPAGQAHRPSPQQSAAKKAKVAAPAHKNTGRAGNKRSPKSS
jgi:hypothetical protein